MNITIVSPSGALSSEYMDGAVSVLAAMGHEVRLSDGARGPAESVFAAPDMVRATDLQRALLDPWTDVVICARGGYGAARTAQLIPQDVWRQTRKILVGFSDITVFHSLLTLAGKSSLHAPMLKHIAVRGAEDDDVRALFDALQGLPVRVTLPPHPLSRPGKAGGKLIGGNLSILYSLRSTPADVLRQCDGDILFIEDLDEYNYHIDRMMQNLRWSGVLSRIGGLVVGQFIGMKDGSKPFGRDAYEIVADAMRDYDVPILFGYPAGHADERNFPLIMGGEATIDGLTLTMSRPM